MSTGAASAALPAVPAGYVARRPRPDDLSEVVRVMRADEAHHAGEADTSFEDMASEWSQPSFDLDVQAVVVQSGDRLVAYAEQVNGRAWVRVDPDHHGHGIGGALADWSIAQARAEGHPQVGQTVHDANVAGAAACVQRGMVRRWDAWLLAIDLALDHPQPTAPDGYAIRALDKANDAEAVHAVIEAAFSTWPDRDAPSSFEDWRASWYDRDDVTSTTTPVVVEEATGQIVAVALGLVEGDEGVIEQLGVLPEHMGKGLGGVALRGAFAGFARLGLRQAVLATESRTGALPFYENAGMHVTRSFTRWTLPLT